MTYDSLVKINFAQNVSVIPSAMAYVLAFEFGLPLLSHAMQWLQPFSTSLYDNSKKSPFLQYTLKSSGFH